MVVRKLSRFRLRTLLLATTLVCSALAFRQAYVEPYRKQREAMGALAEAGAAFATAPAKPEWLRPILGEMFQEVEMVQLEHRRKLTDQHLEHLRDLPFLRRLYLASNNITDDGIKHVRGLSQLQRMSLWRTRVSNEGLRHLSDLSQLEVLDIKLSPVTDEGLAHLPASLTQLIADERVLNARALPHLSRFGKLRLAYLDLGHQGVTDDDLRYLRPLRGVEKLMLGGNPISDDGLVDLASLPGLRSVDLSATHVTTEGLAEFSKRTTAAVTSQSRKEMTERVSDWFRQNRVELVPDTGEPRRLILRSTPWYEMELVPVFQTLTEVRVERSFFNDHQLVHLGRLTNLRHLSIQGTWRITDWGLLHLSSLSQLVELQVPECKVRGWSLRYLANLAQLKTLDLSRNPLADDDLDALAQLPSLRVLSLMATPITDAGLERLYPLTQLERIDIRGCRVTPEAVRELRQTLPNTRIIYEPISEVLPKGQRG